ncbi:MAG TPA: rhodanese-like domain-containing protein, partial [Cyclobacteriaceae bacterium]|nr:rhodanese-like domain-containing protein [Cyclobacteriaceae bacterium]
VVANETNALILDTRNPDLFVKGFIPNSISIGIDGTFAPWVGALIPDVMHELLLITDVGREEEVITRLARVGYDQVVGYLNGGFESWKAAGKETDSIKSISASEFASLYNDKLEVVDVRKPSEFEAEHMVTAKSIPLDYLNDNMSSFDPDAETYLHCAGGYRSVIAASILKSRGFENIVNVEGGFKAIKETTVIPCSNFNCASKN